MDVRTLRERIRNCRTEAHRMADMAADLDRQGELRSIGPGAFGESPRYGRSNGTGFRDTPVQGIRRAAERCASQLSEIEREIDGEWESRERASFGAADYGYGYGRGTTGWQQPRERERTYAAGSSFREGFRERGYASQNR